MDGWMDGWMLADGWIGLVHRERRIDIDGPTRHASDNVARVLEAMRAQQLHGSLRLVSTAANHVNYPQDEQTSRRADEQVSQKTLDEQATVVSVLGLSRGNWSSEVERRRIGMSVESKYEYR